jgi:hypothetical protein
VRSWASVKGKKKNSFVWSVVADPKRKRASAKMLSKK